MWRMEKRASVQNTSLLKAGLYSNAPTDTPTISKIVDSFCDSSATL